MAAPCIMGSRKNMAISELLFDGKARRYQLTVPAGLQI